MIYNFLQRHHCKLVAQKSCWPCFCNDPPVYFTTQ